MSTIIFMCVCVGECVSPQCYRVSPLQLHLWLADSSHRGEAGLTRLSNQSTAQLSVVHSNQDAVVREKRSQRQREAVSAPQSVSQDRFSPLKPLKLLLPDGFNSGQLVENIHVFIWVTSASDWLKAHSQATKKLLKQEAVGHIYTAGFWQRCSELKKTKRNPPVFSVADGSQRTLSDIFFPFSEFCARTNRRAVCRLRLELCEKSPASALHHLNLPQFRATFIRLALAVQKTLVIYRGTGSFWYFCVGFIFQPSMLQLSFCFVFVFTLDEKACCKHCFTDNISLYLSFNPV